MHNNDKLIDNIAKYSRLHSSYTEHCTCSTMSSVPGLCGGGARALQYGAAVQRSLQRGPVRRCALEYVFAADQLVLRFKFDSAFFFFFKQKTAYEIHS